MVGRSKKREDVSPNREQLRSDKGAVAHREGEWKPRRYVPQIYVTREISVLDLLGRSKDDDEDQSSHNNR